MCQTSTVFRDLVWGHLPTTVDLDMLVLTASSVLVLEPCQDWMWVLDGVWMSDQYRAWVKMSELVLV
ncbi:hypothetical protein GCK32_021083, partial [Trichostrongylus colubriformis]